MDQNEIPLGPRHIGVPSDVSKMISEPMVRSAQPVHLSCDKITTISKWTATSFHLSLVTYEYHQVRPKRFLSLWYVWRKPYTNLAPILALSPNRPKEDSTWPMSPMSSIGCVQNYFGAYGTFGANRALILREDEHYLQTDRNELPLEPPHLGVPSGASKTISELWYVCHKPCNNIAPTLTKSPNGSK